MHRQIIAASLARLLGQWQIDGAREPAYRQLAASLRLLILDGRMALDARLPGERELAKSLGLSRGTIAAAYAALRADGYLVSLHGSGSSTALPAGRAPQAAAPATLMDFSVAASPAGPEIHQAYSAALAALPAFLGSKGYDGLGLGALRAAIAARYAARGLPTDVDEVMIVNGALAGFALLLRHLTGPGDRVVIDHPTYPLAIAAIRGAACRPVPVALPEHGWDVEGLAAAIGQTSPRLVYLVADFHNPTGRCMDVATRQSMAALAAATRTTFVVDETMAELWYEGAPPPPLAAHGGDGRIVTLGSTAKSFWGGLRVGWIRAPAATIAALVRVRDALDLGTPFLEQLAVVRLLEDADTILTARRSELRRRRDAMVAAGAEILPDWRFTSAPGGLACWIEMPKPAASQLAAAAEAIDLRIGPGPRFGLNGAFERNLRLPITPEPDVARRALERLAPLWHRLAGSGPSLRAGRPL